MEAPAYPQQLLELVERELGRLAFSRRPATAELEQAMRYSLLAGGKRVRPVLCLATARAVGMAPEQALPTALALELVHTYSLIHDDLPAMDDDAMRRGQPTAHVAFGEDVAILAGDGLFAEAMALLVGRQRAAPANVLAAARELAEATGVEGMVGGQYIDIRGGGSAEAALRELHSLKTGRLIAASVGTALALVGLREPDTIPYRRFATELGVLFQIVDDILDVTGDTQQLGKPRGSDARHGKHTYVSLHGLDGARSLAAEHHRTARSWLDRTGGDTADLQTITDFIATRRS